MKAFIIFICILTVIVAGVFIFINYTQKGVEVISRTHSLTPQPSRVKIMTYNIQHGRGLDNRLDLKRIARTIKESNSQIIGLNEVDRGLPRSNYVDQIRFLADRLDMNYSFAPTLNGIVGKYGNALLSVFPMVEAHNHLLPASLGEEPRGVLEATLKLGGDRLLKVLVTHLSLENETRFRQMSWLHSYLQSFEGVPFVLMGDFNGIGGFPELPGNFHLLGSGTRSYPAYNPRSCINIFITNCSVKEQERAIEAPGSDHLPLVFGLGAGIEVLPDKIC